MTRTLIFISLILVGSSVQAARWWCVDRILGEVAFRWNLGPYRFDFHDPALADEAQVSEELFTIIHLYATRFGREFGGIQTLAGSLSRFKGWSYVREAYGGTKFVGSNMLGEDGNLVQARLVFSSLAASPNVRLQFDVSSRGARAAFASRYSQWLSAMDADEESQLRAGLSWVRYRGTSITVKVSIPNNQSLKNWLDRLSTTTLPPDPLLEGEIGKMVERILVRFEGPRDQRQTDYVPDPNLSPQHAAHLEQFFEQSINP